MKLNIIGLLLALLTASLPAIGQPGHVSFSPHGDYGANQVNLFIANGATKAVLFSLSEDEQHWDAYRLDAKKSGDASPSASEITTLFIKITSGEKPVIRRLSVGKRYVIMQQESSWEIHEIMATKKTGIRSPRQ